MAVAQRLASFLQMEPVAPGQSGYHQVQFLTTLVIGKSNRLVLLQLIRLHKEPANHNETSDRRDFRAIPY